MAASIPTAALVGDGLDGKVVPDQVEHHGSNGVNDGLLITRGTDDMHLNAVQDERLCRPDTFSHGPDGTIYVTTPHIQDSAFFKPDAPPPLPTQLWRLRFGS